MIGTVGPNEGGEGMEGKTTMGEVVLMINGDLKEAERHGEKTYVSKALDVTKTKLRTRCFCKA